MAGYKGSGLITSFSDPLTVVDPVSSNALGPNWLQGSFVLNGNATSPATAYAGIGASSIDSINCLQWRSGGPAAPVALYHGFAVPFPVLNNLVYGKSQFVQATMIQITGTARRAGLSVCLYPSDTNPTHYIFGILGDGSWEMRQWRDGVSAFLTNKGPGSVVNGDILRFSADQSSTTSVILRFTRNGVLDTVVVDPSGTRLSKLGFPGLLSIASNAADKSEWRNFSCGTGL